VEVQLKAKAFLISALGAGELSALTSEKDQTVPIGQEGGWNLEPFWMRWRKDEVPAPAGNRSPVVQLVA